MSKRLRVTVWIAFAALTAACGGDDGDGTSADAAVPDAAIPDAMIGSATFLGQLCGPALACPTDYFCEVPGATGGSTTDGYCSPACTTVGSECTDGYTGPAVPQCFIDERCSLICTTDCPTGLTCLPTGGPTNVCAVPAP